MKMSKYVNIPISKKPQGGGVNGKGEGRIDVFQNIELSRPGLTLLCVGNPAIPRYFV